MKIGAIYPRPEPYLRLVREKGPEQESQGHSRQDQNESRDRDGRPDSDDPERFEVKVEEAMKAFEGDDSTRASGLTAVRQGHGLGLKVVLQASNGTILRECTGEEFLRLRAATASGASGRGKLLDRKY